jgi:hypothetical protein
MALVTRLLAAPPKYKTVTRKCKAVRLHGKS